MSGFYRVAMTMALMLTGVFLAAPGWSEVRTLDPESGIWAVEINAPGASVTVSGMEQPFSTVQVTVYFETQEGAASQSRFPVNVTVFTKAKLTPQKEGAYVKRIAFQCTRGKVQIDARPASGSGGISGDWW